MLYPVSDQDLHVYLSLGIYWQGIVYQIQQKTLRKAATAIAIGNYNSYNSVA